MEDKKNYLVIISGDIDDGDTISKNIVLKDINYEWFDRKNFPVKEQLKLIKFVANRLKKFESSNNLDNLDEIFEEDYQKWQEFEELIEGIPYGGFDSHIHTLEEIQIVEFNNIKKYTIDG